jgi:Ca-activated chloride channel family protein
VNSLVQEQTIILEAAEAKKEAMAFLDKGEIEAARQLLQKTQSDMLNFSDSPAIAAEAEALSDLETRLDQDVIMVRKMALYQSHSRTRGHGFADLAYRLCRGPVKGDITKPLTALGQPIEAIVNSADSKLSDYGALSSAIHRAAGPQLLAACRRLGGCIPGEAKITPGFNLAVDWVIHTVCPPWQTGGEAEEYLRQCYLNSLHVAASQGIQSVAFPAIGVGAMGFPFKRAAEIAMQTVWSFLAHDRRVEAVLFVCYDDQTKRFFDIAFTELTGHPA